MSSGFYRVCVAGSVARREGPIHGKVVPETPHVPLRHTTQTNLHPSHTVSIRRVLRVVSPSYSVSWGHHTDKPHRLRPPSRSYS